MCCSLKALLGRRHLKPCFLLSSSHSLLFTLHCKMKHLLTNTLLFLPSVFLPPSGSFPAVMNNWPDRGEVRLALKRTAGHPLESLSLAFFLFLLTLHHFGGWSGRHESRGRMGDGWMELEKWRRRGWGKECWWVTSVFHGKGQLSRGEGIVHCKATTST